MLHPYLQNVEIQFQFILFGSFGAENMYLLFQPLALRFLELGSPKTKPFEYLKRKIHYYIVCND